MFRMTYNPDPGSKKPSTNLYLPSVKGCCVYKRRVDKYHAQRIFPDKTQITKLYDNKEDAIAFVDSLRDMQSRPVPQYLEE